MGLLFSNCTQHELNHHSVFSSTNLLTQRQKVDQQKTYVSSWSSSKRRVTVVFLYVIFRDQDIPLEDSCIIECSIVLFLCIVSTPSPHCIDRLCKKQDPQSCGAVDSLHLETSKTCFCRCVSMTVGVQDGCFYIPRAGHCWKGLLE